MTIKGKSFTGEVVSVKGTKTAVVSVQFVRRHPIYKKAMRKERRFAAHNEIAGIQVGDTVMIQETKPISKTKHFIITQKI